MGEDFFISYAHENREVAHGVARQLQDLGCSVWWDERIGPTDHWDQSIEKALKEAKYILVLWSASAVESQFVRAEADFARKNGKLLQAVLDACELPVAFRLIQAINLTQMGVGSSAHLSRLADWVQRGEMGGHGKASMKPVLPIPARFSAWRLFLIFPAVLVAGQPLAWADDLLRGVPDNLLLALTAAGFVLAAYTGDLCWIRPDGKRDFVAIFTGTVVGSVVGIVSGTNAASEHFSGWMLIGYGVSFVASAFVALIADHIRRA